jgi:hypothetical protein
MTTGPGGGLRHGQAAGLEVADIAALSTAQIRALNTRCHGRPHHRRHRLR